MPYAKAKDGCMLYYKDWGRGDPVVLLHGWPLSADTWDDGAIGWSRPGTAASSPTAAASAARTSHGTATITTPTPTTSRRCSRMPGSRRRLRSSASRWAAARSRASSPSKARTGSARQCCQLGRALYAADRRQPQRRPAIDLRHHDPEMKTDRADFFQSFFKDFFGVGIVLHPVSDGVLMNAWRQAMMAGLRPTLAAAKAFATTDFRPDLKSFDGVPTLCIHGTADQTVPIDASGARSQAVPGARLIEYDGSAHGLFATDKDRLCEDLIAFLGGDMARIDEAASQSEREPRNRPTRRLQFDPASRFRRGRRGLLSRSDEPGLRSASDRRPAARRLPDRDADRRLRLALHRRPGRRRASDRFAAEQRRSCRCRATSSSTSSCRRWCSRPRFSSNGGAFRRELPVTLALAFVGVAIAAAIVAGACTGSSGGAGSARRCSAC